MIDNSKMMIGEHFTCRGIEWICLDIIDGNYLAITAQVWEELPFDNDSKNNWKESSLRRVLNDEFLGKLNKKHLIKQTSDLIADNGDKAYGSCKDYVTILSCAQYCKYRDVVPLFDGGKWTLTPRNCTSDGYKEVRFLYPNGIFGCADVYSPYGVAPVVLFSSKHLELSRQTLILSYSNEKKIKKGGKI